MHGDHTFNNKLHIHTDPLMMESEHTLLLVNWTGQVHMLLGEHFCLHTKVTNSSRHL